MLDTPTCIIYYYLFAFFSIHHQLHNKNSKAAQFGEKKSFDKKMCKKKKNVCVIVCRAAQFSQYVVVIYQNGHTIVTNIVRCITNIVGSLTIAVFLFFK